MPYDNNPVRFCTDPGGLSTSRYYVFENGTIRAKFAARRILVRPGKNICYVTAGLRVRRSQNARRMKVGDDYVTYVDAMTSSFYQTEGVGKAPVDFYLQGGAYRAAFHRGHAICPAFDAAIGGVPVNEASFDRYITETFADPDDPQRLRAGLQACDISVRAYQRWLRHS
jgi:hypothetical protein